MNTNVWLKPVMIMSAMGLISVQANAYEAGDWIARVGAITVAPDEKSDSIVLPTAPAATTLPGVSVDNDTQLSAMGVYMLSDSLGVEVLAATPFSHDISLKGVNIPAGDTQHLPPTVSVQWYPRGNTSGWQPYLGLGLNYTIFFSEDPSQELTDALGGLLGANRVALRLEDSFGLAAQAGVDIPLNDRWSLNMGVWWVDINTTAKVKTDVGTVKFDVELDPMVYNIGIAYRF
ncbi:MAG: hypothetical protein RLZZ602_1275 [Pseudomonadota bacterium]